MRAKVGVTDMALAVHLIVLLDGLRQTMVTEADEHAGYIVRYSMPGNSLVVIGDDAEVEVVKGKVDIMLAEDAPEWARKKYQRIRYAEERQLSGISK